MRVASLSCGRRQVGRVPLLLMDCDVEENEPEERGVTDRLYAGGSEHRLRQEIVLGIGGVRALQAAGLRPGRLPLERGTRRFPGSRADPTARGDDRPDFAEALEAVRAATDLHDAHAGSGRDRRLRRRI